MRRLLAFTCLALLSGALWSRADARTIEIVSADRLELRRLDDQELIVISGDVVLNVDRDVVRAQRVEYNRSNRTLTLVGQGYYKSVTKDPQGRDTEQVLTGESLVVNLANENLEGEDVIITTTELQIRGEDVQRVPGQLQAQNSYVTPCARCGRTPNDYAFKARQVFLYPGDRMIAYDATLLLADAPVMYLPFVVVFLGDPDRQPRLEIGRDETDGFYARVGLPFVIGTNALGFSLLRYYQNRSPSVGGGVDLTAYNLAFGVRRLDLYALAEPKEVRHGSGYDLDFRVNAVGQLPLDGTRGGLDYTLKIERRDIGRSEALKGVTDVDFTAKAAWEDVNATVNYTGRVGPPPEGPLPRVLKQPEIALDFREFKVGNLGADVNVTFGQYTAPSNPLSRSASAQGVNITAQRLEENHTITYEDKPWSGATFSVRNTFTGRYYSTGARVVNLDIGTSLRQEITEGTEFAVRYDYARQEGTSPFQFDAIAGRRLSGILRLNATTRLAPWLQVTAEQAYDFVQPADRQTAARFGVNVTPDPLDLRANVRYDFFTSELESWDANLNVGRGVGFSAGLSTSFTHPAGYQPLVAFGRYENPDRSAAFKLTATYNLQKGYLESLRGDLNGVSARDAILNPLSLTAHQTFFVHNPRIEGAQSVTWRGVTLRSAHDFLLPDTITEPGEDAREGRGTLTFGLTSPQGAASSWQVQYGGSYDLLRGGWTTPTLTGRYSDTRVNQRITLDGTLNMPGLDRSYLDLASASVNGQWDLTPRIGVRGEVRFNRARSGAGGAVITDTLAFRPFGVTFALGGERPDAYLSVLLDQTFVFSPTATPQPLKPIFQLNVDRCCWSLGLELNPVQERVRLSLTLPMGGQSLDVTRNEGVQIPGLTTRGNN